jgi:3'-phosphoadenosine 5'-phosphosulfate sulfotransferase (PAPS reductase)/FAD synthetase
MNLRSRQGAQVDLFSAPLPPIDLRDYDWIVVNSSAGKDSQAMLDVVVERATAAGVRDRLVVVHCDLGKVEWEGTRELAQEHAAHYGLRFEVVRRTLGGLLDQVRARRMWPDSQNRYCTSDQKRDQVSKLFTRLAWEHFVGPLGLRGPARILNCMGHRAQESRTRAKMVEVCPNERSTSGKRVVTDWRPILHWKLEQVWARCKAAGTRVHPAYALGMPRLSCCFCIFAPRAALVIAGKHNRALLDEYAALEAEIGHTFRVDQTLADVKAAVDADEAAPTDITDEWNM